MLTIAGLDPSSGAGITADLAVFAAHRLFGTSCVTALTVQSTRGVRSVHAVSPVLIQETLQCLGDDLPPSGIKIGMLANASNIQVIASFLRTSAVAHGIPIVLDPVIRSSSGGSLLEGVEALKEELLPLVSWITPNLAELEALSGRVVATRDEALLASRELGSSYPGLGILLTGGHFGGDPDDLVLEPGGDATWLSGRRVEGTSTHGTGCAFSSAFACRLAAAEAPLESAKKGKHYVAEAIRKAVPLGHGHGPLNLLWPLLEAAAG